MPHIMLLISFKRMIDKLLNKQYQLSIPYLGNQKIIAQLNEHSKQKVGHCKELELTRIKTKE